MCGKSQSTNTSSQPNPQAMAAYSNLLGQASNVAQLPFQTYGGEFTAPINQQQQTAGAGINQYAGFAQPYIQQAAGYANQAAQPLTASNINQYLSPYTQDVVNATQAQFNNQNQQQLNMVRGNAAAQGALGGDREGIAEGITAGQQSLAQAPVIAGLYNQGYNTALSTAQQQQQNLGQAAYSLGNLGVAGQNAGLTGAGAELGYGTLQQSTQQAQDQAVYQQFLAQQGYPFQVAQWLAGITTGVGSQMGGTSQTTGPAPNPLAQYGGLGLAALSFLNRGGGIRREGGGRIPGFQMGGMPYAGGSSYIPTINLTPGQGAPKPPGLGGQQQAPADPLKQASSIMDLEKKIQGLGSGGGDVSTFGAQMAGLESGLSADEVGFGDLGAFRRGGRIAGFADGGGFGDPDLSEQAGLYDIPRGGEEYPGVMMPVSPPSFSDRLQSFGARGAPNVENRIGEPTFRQRQHAWKEAPFPLGREIWDDFIQGELGTNYTLPWNKRKLPARLIPRGQLPRDIGTENIGRHRNGGRIAGFADGGGDDSFDDRFNASTDYGSRSAIPTYPRIPYTSQEDMHSLGDIGPGTDFAFNPVRTNGNRAYGPDASDYDLPPSATAPATGAPSPPAEPVPGLAGPPMADTEGGYHARPTSFAPAPEFAAGAPGAGGASPEEKSSGLGLLSRLGINVSPNARQGMLAAGLGMMASRSPYLGNAIGEGGLAGLSAYSGAKKEEFNEEKATKQLQQHAEDTAKKLELETKKLQSMDDHRKSLEQQSQRNFEQSKVPSGYERVEGGLKALPGGPADPEAAGKLAGAKKGATGVQLPDEAWETHGDDFLKYLPASDRDFVKKVANYEIDPKTLSVVGGHRENALKMASTYDPDFDQKTYNQRFQAIQRFTTGKQGDTVRSLNVAVEHLGTLGELTKALNNGDVQAVNRISNVLTTQFGAPAVTNFNTGKQIIADEVLKAVLGTGAGSQQDREQLQAQFSAANSPAQLMGAIGTAQKLMAGQVVGLKQQYEFATGAHNFDKMLTPATRQVLQGPGASPAAGPAAAGPAGGGAQPQEGERRQFKQGWGVFRNGQWVPAGP